MARPKKRLHELVPIRKGGRAVVNYGGRSGIYLGPWDEARDEPSPAAAARLAELVALWRADPAATARPRGEGVTLAVLWAEWQQSPEAAGRNAENVERAERHLFGTEASPGPYRYHKAAAFRGEELRAVQRALCAAKLSRLTVARTVAAIRKCFAWGLVGRAVTWEQYREMELVEPPARGQVKESAPMQKGVAWKAVAAALPHLSPPLAAACRLLWWTGARPSEVLGLRAGDVRRGGKLLAASGVVIDLDKLKVWAAVKEEHKTDDGGYDRVIFFGPKSQAVLGPLLAERGEGEPLFRPADGREWRKAVIRARYGRGGPGSRKPVKGAAGKRQAGETYGYHALNAAVRRACEASGGGEWSPQRIRRAVARLVQQAWGREAARVFLGHKVGGVTERYAGGDLEAAARVARKWG